MKIETSNGTVIELYDSIKTMPRERYSLFNKYSLQHGQLGGNIRASLVDAMHYANKEQIDKLRDKLENIILQVYAMESGHSFEVMQWGSMVRSVNGIPFEFTEANVDKLLADAQIDFNTFEQSLEALKKKSIES